MTTETNTIDLTTATVREVADRIQVAGLDLDVKAGAFIMRGFGGGSLLEWAAIRAHLYQDERGRIYVRWRSLGEAIDANDEGLMYLSSSARGALELAVALATGRPVSDLGRLLCRFDRSNAEVVRCAVAIPLHWREG